MTKTTKNIMLHISKNLLGRLGSETPQINHGLLLDKYLISLYRSYRLCRCYRSNRICRCYWNAFADRGGNMSVTDTNRPNSPLLVTITLSGEKCNSLLPTQEQLPSSPSLSARFLQSVEARLADSEVCRTAGLCSLGFVLLRCRANLHD